MDSHGLVRTAFDIVKGEMSRLPIEGIPASCEASSLIGADAIRKRLPNLPVFIAYDNALWNDQPVFKQYLVDAYISGRFRGRGTNIKGAYRCWI